jgi:hypothetical protein
MSSNRALAPTIGVPIIVALSALSWLAWLGWDHQYQVDSVTGLRSGPYETWQVAGCALSLLVVFVGALWAGVRPWLASVSLTVAFTAAWTVQAARSGDSGLYVVGAALLLVGLSAGTAIVAAAVSHIRALRVGRRRISDSL